MNSVAAFAALAVLGVASGASAVILTGGPVYNLPGGGTCTVSGVSSQSGGASITCTGVVLSAHTKVYFGIRNASNVNGNTMTGSSPAAASPAVFRFLSNTGTSITYSSTTSVNDLLNGSQPVDNRLVLTRTAGTLSVVSASGNPADNGNGDVRALFQVTSGSSFTIRADVQSSDAIFPALGNSCPAVFDPTHTSIGTSDISKVDVAFYYSDCGDGVIDSPEVCDEGGANGSPSSCCTTSCQFRASGATCRPGAGAPCDFDETCTGASATCPIDDAPLHFGDVCRAGSGDVCDANELCTGVPGQACPPDDAPGQVGVVCRVGTVGDICDESEVCSGAPGATCPADDAPGKINLVCRAGSGDICDPDERCTGFPGQGCPANIVSNPSTVCRGGTDMCDPAETCTAIPGEPCPANNVTPSGTQCRAAAGACDVAEQCTGSAGQSCPSNAQAPSGTACNVDANVCTIDQCNGSGSCVLTGPLDCEDGNICTQDSCDPEDGCVSVGTPANNCTVASKSTLKIKDALDPSKDNIKFLWKGGPSLVSNMGDPTGTVTRYELCIYDQGGVRMAMGVAPGAGWTLVGSPGDPKGYKYKDLSSTQDGVKLIKTKGSNLDKAKVSLAGRGGNLPDTAQLPFEYPVTAQLYASDGMCWEAQYTQPQSKKNDTGGFSAKTP